MPDRDITIILADDHTIVRQGLAKLLEGEPGLNVVGEAENGREAVSKVEGLKPDVVIMDISMPMLNGIEATRQIKKIRPETRVIILSMHCHDGYIRELFSLGASGYLLKDSTGSDIVKAIQAAMDGDTYMSPPVSRLVIEDYVSTKKKSFREELYSSLSNREREVFQIIAEGNSTREISEILCISPSTVKTHRSKIMEKLRIENISQLVQFAIRIGIVDLHS
ncbi:MAG: response regulator transcription factor [Deltaproteobacteria bacterium]|nr:response regulator transcription factor [Deltaproteobacteria bacterium]MBW2116321.1 response regulator transcription factor [Deltaproteobacteria bacterium]MBW2342595.1 response regulator transcription factor [Deltaproteobacteria bacterium]